MAVHKICRTALYFMCGSEAIQRFTVPEDRVPWVVEFPSYNPTKFTLPGMSDKPWADPEIAPSFSPKWNSLDGKIDRRSHDGPYEIVEGYPLNPRGRTGLCGRGRLGRWGPNHAADPIVTRWKRQANGTLVTDERSGLPVLQFVAIQRQDCGQWAIPGGMIDPGEVVTITLKREFCEEAMNSLVLTPEDKERLEKSISSFFDAGKIVYKGYVDDPRNTDNAWMETAACNFHDETGDIVGRFPLQAGDDASHVQWRDISMDLKLYANHIEFLRLVTVLRKAHF